MAVKQFILGPLFNYISRLRFPWLFAITGALFVADFLVPDLIPFADELLLGLTTLILGAWKKRKHTTVENKPIEKRIEQD